MADDPYAPAGLHFIDRNPATDAYNEAEKVKREAETSNIANEGRRISNDYERAATPTKLRNISAEAGLHETQADVAKQTAPYDVTNAYNTSRTGGATADVAVGTVAPKISEAQSAASTAATNAGVTRDTAPYKVSEAGAESRLKNTEATVAERTEPDKIEASGIANRQARFNATKTEMDAKYKVLDLLKEGRDAEAVEMAKQANMPLPLEVLHDTRYRAVMTGVADQAKATYPDQPVLQHAFIDAHMKEFQRQEAAGVPIDTIAQRYMTVPGTPEIPKDTSKPVSVPAGGALVRPQSGEVMHQGANGLSEAATEVAARQIINGDLSSLTNVGRGAQGDAKLTSIKNKAADILVNEYGMTPTDAAGHLSTKLQAYKAAGVGQNTEARTTATRESNLNLILKAADAAIPAALEASDAVTRYAGGFVPLNRIIQGGQVMTSDPALKRFGMANLQLAEHWARAMNPTGVMRESDRDKALSFLSTADSADTYRQAVDQLHTQIVRERDAVASHPTTATPAPAAAGAPGAAPVAPAPLAPGGGGPPAPPLVVKQNGHTYQRQSDGTYLPIE